MYNFLISILLLLFPTTNKVQINDYSKVNEIKEIVRTDNFNISDAQSLYKELDLQNKISFQIFSNAYNGYFQISDKKKEILTIIDFTQPSVNERMFVIDILNKKLLFQTVVAHGKNSGDMYATSFSNKSGSYKSSLGFFLTSETYHGGNGYSLKLDGLEKDINDKARERAIVIHGAKYADPSVTVNGRRLGRSLGCPALPTKVAKPIIDTIKNGSVLFIYAENDEYQKKSSIVNYNI